MRIRNARLTPKGASKRAAACLWGTMWVVLSACSATITPSQRAGWQPTQYAEESRLVYAPHEVPPASPDAEIVWPRRVSAGLPELSGQNVAGEYFLSSPKDRVGSAWLYAFSIALNGEHAGRMVMNARGAHVGNCWVRWFGDDYPDRRGPVPADEARITIGSNTCFQVCCWRADAQLKAHVFDPDVPTAALFQQSEALVKSGDFRQEFALWMPDSLNGTPPEIRGMCVVLSPISNSNYTSGVRNELLRRGWALLVQTQIQFALPLQTKDATTLGRAGVFVQQRPGDFARMLDEEVADQAYAVEAAIAHVRRMRPELFATPKPVALLGFSLGALVGVTSGARIANELSAAVFVGGGTHFGSVLIRSQVLRRDDGEPLFQVPEHRMAQLELDYLAASRLDAFHTAGQLLNTPTLLIDGRTDGIVNSRYAHMLWQRLGKPERWTIDGGHSVLFLSLDRLAPSIGDWLERAALQPPRGYQPGGESP